MSWHDHLEDDETPREVYFRPSWFISPRNDPQHPSNEVPHFERAPWWKRLAWTVSMLWRG